MKNKKIIIWIIVAAVIALIGGGIYFVMNRSDGNDEEAVYGQKVSSFSGVSLAVNRYSGVVEAQKTVEFKKDSSRKIETVYVTEGQNVGVDEPLFRYDVREAQNAISSASLEIEGYNNQINILSQEGGSDAALEIARLQVSIQQEQAEISRRQQEISNADVCSTIAGVVKAVNENGGMDAMGNELPVVSVSMTGDLRIKGKVSEQSVSTLSSGMNVIVRSRVDENKTWTGTIDTIETEPASENQNVYYGSESSERASFYPFYITLDSTDGLMLGQHVFIEPDYGQSKTKEGIWIPTDFIVNEENGAFVYVSENGRLKKRNITAGETDEEENQTEIKKGLSKDDLIVYPDESLKEGQKVIDVAEAE